MGRREVYAPQAGGGDPGCVFAMIALAVIGVFATAVTSWVWPLLLAVPGVMMARAAVREHRSIRAGARYLRAANRRGLLIYSDSPLWKDYIHAQWLPRLGGSLDVLNWSERRRWDSRDPRVRLFRACAGEEDFNPTVMLLRDRGAPLVFRFYPAFKNAKHGNREGLDMLERELFSALGLP